MNKKINIIIALAFIALIPSCTMKKEYVYKVAKANRPFEINALWDKDPWKKIKAVEIKNYMGDIPEFHPKTQAKMCYTDKDIFLIFHVDDKYIRCITNEINGPVWEDSTVEFFFAPDTEVPLKYFNLEINCGGTFLFFYNIIPRKERVPVSSDDQLKIEIAHSLPKLVDPEITEQIAWTIECRIPLDVLRKYSNVTTPAKGVKWKANFYKIAVITSNPHYITWSVVENDKPDFHLPAFFGDLIFD